MSAVTLLLLLCQTPEALALKVEMTRPEYVPGQPIAFHLTASRDCFLYLFNLKDDTYKLLLPEPGQSLELVAGQALKLPDAAYNILADKPGKEVFYFIANARPIQWEMTLARAPGETLAFKDGEFVSFVEHMTKQGPVAVKVEARIVKPPGK